MYSDYKDTVTLLAKDYTQPCTYSLICWGANVVSEKDLRVARWALLVFIYACIDKLEKSPILQKENGLKQPR